MILAIVGTRRFGNPNAMRYAHMIISLEVLRAKHGSSPLEIVPYWDSFVTGDADGIDRLVKEICDGIGSPAWYKGAECRVLAPENRRWEPHGYKARNILIAEACDELLCIRDPGSATYGSGWTANYAESLGKPVTRIEIS